MNKIDYGKEIIDMVTQSPEEREEARIENLEYEAECKEDRDFEEQERFDSGMKDSD